MFDSVQSAPRMTRVKFDTVLGLTYEILKM